MRAHAHSSIPPRIDAPQNGSTPLILALKNGHPEIAALLLEKGADKDAKGQVGHRRRRPCERMWMALTGVCPPSHPSPLELMHRSTGAPR